jgi:hypothetical protein
MNKDSTSAQLWAFHLSLRLVSPHKICWTNQRKGIRFWRQWPWKLCSSAMTPRCTRIVIEEPMLFLHHDREPTACIKTLEPDTSLHNVTSYKSLSLNSAIRCAIFRQSYSCTGCWASKGRWSYDKANKELEGGRCGQLKSTKTAKWGDKTRHED